MVETPTSALPEGIPKEISVIDDDDDDAKEISVFAIDDDDDDGYVQIDEEIDETMIEEDYDPIADGELNLLKQESKPPVAYVQSWFATMNETIGDYDVMKTEINKTTEEESNNIDLLASAAESQPAVPETKTNNGDKKKFDALSHAVERAKKQAEVSQAKAERAKKQAEKRKKADEAEKLVAEEKAANEERAKKLAKKKEAEEKPGSKNKPGVENKEGRASTDGGKDDDNLSQYSEAAVEEYDKALMSGCFRGLVDEQFNFSCSAGKFCKCSNKVVLDEKFRCNLCAFAAHKECLWKIKKVPEEDCLDGYMCIDCVKVEELEEHDEFYDSVDFNDMDKDLKKMVQRELGPLVFIETWDLFKKRCKQELLEQNVEVDTEWRPGNTNQKPEESESEGPKSISGDDDEESSFKEGDEESDDDDDFDDRGKGTRKSSSTYKIP